MILAVLAVWFAASIFAITSATTLSITASDFETWWGRMLVVALFLPAAAFLTVAYAVLSWVRLPVAWVGRRWREAWADAKEATGYLFWGLWKDIYEGVRG